MFNIAIVGCGYWGPNLLRNFNALPPVAIISHIMDFKKTKTERR